MNLRADIAYDGAPFHGFARQRDVRTVQGELEASLAKLFKHDVVTIGAGRTDAGVHALGQVVGIETPTDDFDPVKVRDALNGMCGPAMAVWSCSPASPTWHARFSARSRTYVYSILRADVHDPFLARTTLFHPEPLDGDAMNEAAGHLVGRHDFRSFGRPAEPGADTTRELYELNCTTTGSLINIRARANAFITQMVRSLVGTLIQVGEGRRTPDDMPHIRDARERAAAGPVAAPHGLCLVSVEYDEGWSRPFDPFE